MQGLLLMIKTNNYYLMICACHSRLVEYYHRSGSFLVLFIASNSSFLFRIALRFACYLSQYSMYSIFYCVISTEYSFAKVNTRGEVWAASARSLMPVK